MIGRAAVSVLLASAALVADLPAGAAPGPDASARARAAESFREGQAAFERREFAAAAAAFEAAAGFVPHPAALLSAADAWERAGEAARAAGDCDRARALAGAGDVPSGGPTDYAGDATRCLDRLGPRVALLDLRGTGAVAVRIDDGPEQVPPLRAWTRPGHHVLTVIDLGTSRTHRRDVDVTAGERRRIDVSPDPVSTAAAPAASPAAPAAAGPSASAGERPHPVPTSSWLAFGVAAPAAVAYGVFAFMTVAASSSYDGDPTPSSRDAFYRDRTLADVTFGVAAVAAAVGIVVWLATPSRDPAAPASVAPGVLRF